MFDLLVVELVPLNSNPQSICILSTKIDHQYQLSRIKLSARRVLR